MKNGSYHHGNLKAELIELGLEYIDRNGVENLSLRKLADLAGVSCAAPYAHFKNKDEFLSAVQEYITEQFTDVLKKAAGNCRDRDLAMIELGICYVKFFYDNPLYYRFLFNGRMIDLKTYKPFMVFGEITDEWLTLQPGNMDEDSRHYTAIALWSMVHGLAQMVTIKGAIDTDHLENEIKRILLSVKIGED